MTRSFPERRNAQTAAGDLPGARRPLSDFDPTDPLDHFDRMQKQISFLSMSLDNFSRNFATSDDFNRGGRTREMWDAVLAMEHLLPRLNGSIAKFRQHLSDQQDPDDLDAGTAPLRALGAR